LSLVSYPKVPSDKTHFIGYEGLVQEYYSWLLSGEPKYHGYPTEPLFCHGTISYAYDEKKGFVVNEPINIRVNLVDSPQDLSERISTDTLVVVDVLSSFFFQGDIKENGDTIRTRRECYMECSNDYVYERDIFATIRQINATQEEKLDPVHVGPVAINVDPVNPYLERFAGSPQKLSSGQKVGYASVYLCVFNVKNVGEYIIEYGGEGKPPYHSQGCIQLVVSGTPMMVTGLKTGGKIKKLPLSVKPAPH
jgi:hypothetical protein